MKIQTIVIRKLQRIFMAKGNNRDKIAYKTWINEKNR